MNKTENQIRIALANHEHIVRSALKVLLEQEPEFVVVGDVADGSECVGLVEETQPDVFVMEAEMPNHQPVKTVRIIRRRQPDTRVVVLSAHDRTQFVVGLIQAGVAGYVLKDDPPETLVRAIRAVVKDLDWISPRVAETLIESVKNNGKSHRARLTHREREVLQLMARGLRNCDIAIELDLAEKTIKNYASRMYRKLGVTTRLEAVLFALDTGLVVLASERE